MNAQVKSGGHPRTDLQPQSTQIGLRERASSQPTSQASVSLSLSPPLFSLSLSQTHQCERLAQLTLQLQQGFSCWPVERNRNETGFRIKRCAHLQRKREEGKEGDEEGEERGALRLTFENCGEVSAVHEASPRQPLWQSRTAQQSQTWRELAASLLSAVASL